jgi:hypothetical protein
MSEVTSAPDAPAPSEQVTAQTTRAIAPVRARVTRTPEAQKTPEQRAEDIAYTINHAVSCATTDLFIVPTIAAGFNPRKANYWAEASGYLRGEIIGDFLAVPFTIGVQRLLPSFMESVRHIVEPVATPFFHHGARSAAERWGKRHGYAANDNEVADRAEEIFQHEIDHLPQALVWNMFSFPLGVLGQGLTGHHGGLGNWAEIARGKLLGTAISNVLLIGARALLPDKAEKFDRLDGKYVIRPVTRAFSGVIGIDSKTVDRMDAKAEEAEQRENGSWRARVKQQDEVAATTRQSV